MQSQIVGSRTRRLALLGGVAAFREPLHVGRPNVGDSGRLSSRIEAMLESRWLSNSGPFEQEFEQRVSAVLGVRHCIATSNATLALQILARALGLAGEVIVPAFTFVATVHALRWEGLTPLFCDIDADTHNLSPAHAAALVTDRTSAILGVHLWGRPCAVDELATIAKRKRLALIFDGAHAFGSSYRGKPIGNFGCAEVLSFHATKFVSCAEGGAIVTNDDMLADRVRAMRNFGFVGYDKVAALGINAKLSEPCAAVGLTNLESADIFRAANKENFAAYAEGLRGAPGVTLLQYDERSSPSYHYVVVQIDRAESGLSRDDLLEVLHAENVLARRYFYPGVHRMEPYLTASAMQMALPNTEWVAERVLVLPTGTAVSTADVSVICDIIRAAVASHQEVAERLGKNSGGAGD